MTEPNCTTCMDHKFVGEDNFPCPDCNPMTVESGRHWVIKRIEWYKGEWVCRTPTDTGWSNQVLDQAPQL